MYIQHPTLGDDELAEAAEQAAGGLVGVTMAGEGIVEILPLGLNKATGLSLAARRSGEGRRHDRLRRHAERHPDVRVAAHGVAMANAHADLKAVADEVTLSNEEDGIAVVLERLLA